MLFTRIDRLVPLGFHCMENESVYVKYRNSSNDYEYFEKGVVLIIAYKVS